MFACNAQFSMHWGRQCAAPNGLPHAGPGDAPKGASPGLGGGADAFFVSVVLCWQNVKICECLLAMPSFQCIGGGSVPPPMPCQTLGRAVRRKARRLALAKAPNAFFSVVLCSQNVKICECLLAMPSFQCIGGGSVPAPNGCRTLGWAARRKARRLALADVPILFFSVVLCWQNVKICECLLAMPSFQCIWGRQCAAPNALPDAGPGGAPKGASPSLGGGLNAIFCLVSGASSCGKTRCRGKTGVAMQCTASRLETLQTAPLKTP